MKRDYAFSGLPEPKSVNGIVQTPIEGTSPLYAFNDAQAPERHKTQYFEMFGNRTIYHDGWFARTIHNWRGFNLRLSLIRQENSFRLLFGQVAVTNNTPAV